MTWPFGDLQMFRYGVIVIDPPWQFDLWSESGNQKSASRQYDVMDLSAIAALPVGQLARGDCLLLLWACGCMLPQALDVMKAWGFVYKSEMIWRKVYKSGAPRMGTGYRVRSMHEPILVGTIGNPKHRAMPSVFDGVAREHSRKPEEFYKLLAGRTEPERCDLFSRETRPGFAGWGREHGKFDAREVA